MLVEGIVALGDPAGVAVLVEATGMVIVGCGLERRRRFGSLRRRPSRQRRRRRRRELAGVADAVEVGVDLIGVRIPGQLSNPSGISSPSRSAAETRTRDWRHTVPTADSPLGCGRTRGSGGTCLRPNRGATARSSLHSGSRERSSCTADRGLRRILPPPQRSAPPSEERSGSMPRRKSMPGSVHTAGASQSASVAQMPCFWWHVPSPVPRSARRRCRSSHAFVSSKGSQATPVSRIHSPGGT